MSCVLMLQRGNSGDGCAIDVCIWRMFVFVSVVVTVWGSVGMFVV